MYDSKLTTCGLSMQKKDLNPQRCFYCVQTNVCQFFSVHFLKLLFEVVKSYILGLATIGKTWIGLQRVHSILICKACLFLLAHSLTFQMCSQPLNWTQKWNFIKRLCNHNRKTCATLILFSMLLATSSLEKLSNFFITLFFSRYVFQCVH